MDTNVMFAFFFIIGMGTSFFALGWVLAYTVLLGSSKLVDFCVNRTAKLAKEKTVVREWFGLKSGHAMNSIVRWLHKRHSNEYGMGRCNEAADTIERLCEALSECSLILEAELAHCEDQTTAWYKLCNATRNKALAALGEKER